MKRIQQTFAVQITYPVTFTRNLFAVDSAAFRELFSADGHLGKRKLLFVIDEGVADAHPALQNQINTYLKAFSDLFADQASFMIVPGGEACKNDYSLVEAILEAVNDHKICRHSYLVAIGGGAVLDMAGYAATIAHRGIRHIRIPTTVLSQNDSGIGVKNSVNYFHKKNFLGTFAPPFAVINDSNFLLTLEDRDWRSGISEAIKVALIKDLAFFEWIERNSTLLNARDMKNMEYLVYRCAELHLQHIAGGDPFEKGSSRPLDFGHWAAHKLEQSTQYRLRHGEAVAIGIGLDTAYSWKKGLIDKIACQRVLNLIQKLGFALYVPELDAHFEDMNHFSSLLRGLEEFREHLGGKLTIMLLEALGEGLEVHEMDGELIRESIQHLKACQQGVGIKS